MSEVTARSAFAHALLAEVAPDEQEFAAAYDAAIDDPRNRRAGTGFGLPPEMVGALGMVAVLVGRAVFDELLEWSGTVAADIAKKFIVDTAVERLKSWIKAPEKETLTGVLTPLGQSEILAIVDRDAEAAGLAAERKQRLRSAVLERLGLSTKIPG